MRSLVAIVGRPDVGKSTLFNRLIGRRLSIVDSRPGVTRDRIYAPTEWNGREFVLIDTGGITDGTEEIIPRSMREQAEIAIEMADVIVFVVDAKTGLLSGDEDVAMMLRRSKKPVIPVVNKCDTQAVEDVARHEFYALGWPEVYPISAEHGRGTGDLLDAIVAALPSVDPAADSDKYTPGESVVRDFDDSEDGEEDEGAPPFEADPDKEIRLAIVGRPNVGKSSLVNYLLREERAIVSDIPGTTRDAVDTQLRTEKDGDFILTDTAGLRRRSRVRESIEFYSYLRALAAVERSDVCLIMLDATEGVTAQDTKVAGLVNEQGKGAIFVVNKWDINRSWEESATAKNPGDYWRRLIAERFSFMVWAPVLFISARTGAGTGRILPLVREVWRNSIRYVPTGVLNTVISEAQALTPAPQDKGKRLNIRFATQVRQAPPTFVLFCRNAQVKHFSYERYIENQIRRNFDFRGTPIRIFFREQKRNE